MSAGSTIAVNPSDSAERNPWDKRPEEGSKAFHAFTIYRDMGFERTCTAVAKQLNRAIQLISRWKGKYDWKTRVDAYDQFQDELAQRANVNDRAEFHKAALTIAKAMQFKALQGIQALQTVQETTTPAGKTMRLAIKPNDLIRLLESSHKIQRNVLGREDEDHVARIEVTFGDAPEEDDVAGVATAETGAQA